MCYEVIEHHPGVNSRSQVALGIKEKSSLLRGGGISCDIAFMNVPLTAEIHRDGEWFVAFCPEVPEANGQGRTKEECLASLREAVLLLMEDRREDARKRLKKKTALLELA